MKRTFEFNDGKSNKFWTIDTDGNSFTVNFGKAGTNGQSQTKTFSDEAGCQKEAEKLIREKTRKGYQETSNPAVNTKTAATPAAPGMKIPGYKVPESAADELSPGEYIVDLENPLSIASVLKHHIDHFDEYLESISDGSLDYGIWNGEDFENYFTHHSYSEEPFYEAAVSYPELHPLLEQFIELAVNESEGASSGPWSSEETVLGEIAAYNLALANPAKYKPLFLKLKKANPEVRFSEGFKQRFRFYLDDIKKAEDEQKSGKGRFTSGGQKDKYGFTPDDYQRAAEVFKTAGTGAIQALLDEGFPVNEPLYPLGNQKTVYYPVNLMVKYLENAKGNDIYDYYDRIDEILVLLFSKGASTYGMIEDAVKYGLCKTILYFIEKEKADPTKILKKATSYLGTGYKSRDKAGLVELLIDKGGDPAKVDGIMQSVACFAHTSLLRRLVEEFGLPIDEMNSRGKTPREVAEYFYQEKDISGIEKKAKGKTAGKMDSFGYTPIDRLATCRNQEANISYLKEREAQKPEKSITPGEKDRLTQQLLELFHPVVKEHGNLDNNWMPQARKLLKDGADPNARYEDGSSIMHRITRHYYPSLLIQQFAILKEFGIDANVFDQYGRTPLHYFFASYGGDSFNAISELVKAGIDTSHKDHDGLTILGYINARYGAIGKSDDLNDSTEFIRDQTISDMVSAGVYPNDINPAGETIIHAVVRFESEMETDDIVREAVKNGADINARNKEGRTALHDAVQQPKRSFGNRHLSCLIENGANVNVQDNDGNTAFHLSNDPKADFYDLLKGNPDLSIKNMEGKSILDTIRDANLSNSRIQDMVNRLLSEPAAERKLPALQWHPHAINTDAAAPRGLNIRSTLLLQGNDGEYDLTCHGNNLLAVKGNTQKIFPFIQVIDTASGKIVWEVTNGANNYHHEISDNKAIYIAREENNRYITAHDKPTGKVTWKASLSNSYEQFRKELAQDDDYIIQANNSKIMVISKATGKVYARMPYVNGSTSASYGPFVKCWNQKVLIAADHKKTGELLVDVYDIAGKQWEKSIPVAGCEAAKADIIIGDFMYLFAEDGIIYKIDLTAMEIVHAAESGIQKNCVYVSPFDVRDNKMYYLAHSYIEGKTPPEQNVFCIYDLATDTIAASPLPDDIPFFFKGPGDGDAYTVGCQIRGTSVYCFSDNTVRIYDVNEKQYTAQLKMPNYGGHNNICRYLIAGDSIYIVQEGGLEYKNGCVLHQIN